MSKSDTLPEHALAVVGMGCLFPKAAGVDAFWDNIREGVDAITEVPDSHWNPGDYFDDDPKSPDMTYARRGGFLDPVAFDPLLYGLSPNTLEATDTTQLLGMVVARQALLDAGYSTAREAGDGREFDRDRTSVIMGVTGTLELVIPLGARLGHPLWRRALKDAGVDEATANEVVERISEGYVPWQENSFPGLLGNVAAGRIANRFDLGGTNCVVDAACASSLSAIHMAMLELQAGRADMAIAGGFDTFNDIFMYMCFSKTPALSPSGNSRPFARGGDGTILGEGLGAVVLKRLEDARRDGDTIQAVIRGIGSSSDGRGNAIYAPSASGQTKALRRAYENAGISPATVELVEAHGTGTAVGDAVEAEALREVYREARPEGSWCALGSVKSMIGHTKSAAGAAGLIKAVLALKHRVLPPTLKVDEPLPELEPGSSPHYINTLKRPWLAATDHPRRAALSALGFGGSNFHCVVEEAEARDEQPDWPLRQHLFAFSAASEQALWQQVDQMLGEVGADDHQQLRRLAAESRAGFDVSQTVRLSLVLDGSDIAPLLVSARKALAELDRDGFRQLPNGITVARGHIDGQTAVLFPGQGAQYCGMLRDLACAFPQLRQTLERANAADDEARLSDVLYPIPVFTDAAREQQEQLLRDTRNAQPAIGAVSLGAWKVLQDFGLVADVFAGHSYGELVALSAAGVFDEHSLHQLSRLRGQLMAADDADRGGMLAIATSRERVEALIQPFSEALVLANHNAPEQVVVSGQKDALEQLQAQCREAGLQATPLPVSAAFHSPLVADAEQPLGEALGAISFSQSRVRVLANTSADDYPDDADAARALLAGQLARPVEFVAQIERMLADGVRCFVEIGPGQRLAGLVRRIAGDRKEVAVLSLDASSGKRSGMTDLARMLGALAVLGRDIDLSRWDAPALNQRQEPAARMTVTLSGANYVSPRDRRPPSPPKPAPAVQSPAATPAPAPVAASQPEPTRPTNSPTMTSKTPPQPASAATPTAFNQEALQATQQSIMALQRLQEQTADLHRQYLQGQETAQQTIHQLLEQQQRLLGLAPNAASHAAPTPVVTQPAVSAAPAPVPAQTPAVTTPTAAATPVQEPVAEPAAAAASSDPEIDSVLLEVVSEKTGYPLEMLSLDMSLDTDLGIDSIKRVEILSTLQERLPWAPTVNPEELGTFHFLQHIVEYLTRGAPDTASPATAASAAPAEANTAHADALLDVVAEKTGYPLEMLELPMNLETDLGIDSIKRVEILSALQERCPDLPAVQPEDLGRLQTLQQIVDHLGASAPAAPAAPAASSTGSDHSQALLDVVAEKTGYPLEMLELPMNLETDLGIDSIKRVEILSALQERCPDLPAVQPEDLGRLQTLQQIVDHLGASAPVVTAAPAASSTGSDHSQALLDVVAEKTGYPLEMVELPMNLETDLGIDSIKRVEILSALQERCPDLPAVQPEDLGRLQTLQQIVDHLGASSAPAPVSQDTDSQQTDETEQDSGGDPLLRQVLICEQQALVRGAASLALSNSAPVWVVTDAGAGKRELQTAQSLCEALTTRGYQAEVVSARRKVDVPVQAAFLIAPAQPSETWLADSFSMIQALSPALKKAAGQGAALLAAISAQGGCFALDSESATDASPLAAGVAGLVKTAAQEWPNVSCHVIDVDDIALQAEAIIDECLHGASLETGLRAQQRLVLTLRDDALPGSGESPIEAGDLVVISGGARGVTASVARALAERYQASLLLLGRTELPEQEDAALSACQTVAELKRCLMQQAGKGVTPAQIEARSREVLAEREIRQNLARIRATGVDVEYRAVDVRDAGAVAKCLQQAREEIGPIRGLIHAAGVLADKRIEDKTLDQFDRVIGTKLDGAHNLLAATRDDALALMVMFSSSTARFGRTGQCDYAAANEVLNKLAQQQARLRADCRVLSINWGPWNGGMVTPALKQLFASEGVGVIGLDDGAAYLMDELSQSGPVEIVILGGVDSDRKLAPQTGAAPQQSVASQSVATARAAGSKPPVALRRELSLEGFPFLADHVMNGRAVLPAALITEWFAHGALHGQPGMHYLGLDDFRILKGVTLAADESLTLEVCAAAPEPVEGGLVIPMELHGPDFLHARARVLLSDQVAAPQGANLDTVSGKPIEQGYYQDGRLFHGASLQGIDAVNACSEAGLHAIVHTAPAPTDWIRQPVRSRWIGDPLVLDACFQLMILWSFNQSGIGSLPTAIGRYRQFGDLNRAAEVEVRIVISAQQGQHTVADIELLNQQGELLARIEGYECIGDASLSDAFGRNQLAAA